MTSKFLGDGMYAGKLVSGTARNMTCKVIKRPEIPLKTVSNGRGRSGKPLD